MSTKTRFEKEAQDNLQMANSKSLLSDSEIVCGFNTFQKRNF